MNISEKTFNRVYNLLLFLIVVTLVFRKLCTIFLVIFVIFNLLFIKKAKISIDKIVIMGLIASPLLLEFLFFANNDSYSQGLKSLEKSVSLLFLPLLIIGNYQRVNYLTLLKAYSIATTCIILLFFIRFIVFFPEQFYKYLNGVHLWEMGYVFSDSIGIHAPALNMHLAFVAFTNLYFLIESLKEKYSNKYRFGYLILFLLSFFFVLYVNTRMALIGALLGFIIVVYFQLSKVYSYKKVIKTASFVFFVVSTILYLFLQKNTFMKEKYSTQIFLNMDMVGKLDEINHPEIAVYSSFVTRVSIWKSAWELSLKNLPFGVGASDGKPELINYFKQTNQLFLATYEFPTHNQFLDYLLKFGLLGPIVVFFYLGLIGFLGIKTQNPVIFSFFILFFISNLTDDFLLRFDGIVFSGVWISIFSCYYFQKKENNLK
jgi:O-antigen ligase